ncbi:amidase [Nocardia amamiensis]|uniref:amidase n=1 Tax=Nocardia amamiensis TaxID=404578 RepID=A0ABS0CU72_9NOCA|nr:amidase family protein [Nocardia amamiensis]MBF6299690.1 amidase [Nocardia amamiensis]
MSDDAAVMADGSLSTRTAAPRTTIRNSRTAEVVAQLFSAAADTRSGRGREAEPDPGHGTAATIAAAVRDGALLPSRVVAEAATRLPAAERESNALPVLRVEWAMADAAALEERDDLDALPLAGVPVAVEPGASITGTPARWQPEAGYPVAARLRGAGAVVFGLGAGSEQDRRDPPDAPARVVHNPWNTARHAGGSAGAAVAAGLVPLAHSSDGLDSVRVAAACCGVFGIKPGCYTAAGTGGWPGMVENGVLATTVQDAALALAVLAARPNLAEVDPPGRLRIGLAVDPPSNLIRVDRHWTAAARRAASVAAAAGHLVETTAMPYGNALFAVFLRWLAAGERDAPALSLPEPPRLSRRIRRQLALGRTVHQLRVVRPAQIDRVEARLLEFFDRYDVVITPTLAAPPPMAEAWHSRSQPAALLAGARFAPFTPLWNLVGWPAASVPMGMHPSSRTPVAAQLAGPPGSESTLLRLAAQLETRHPWQRIAPSVRR